MNGVNRRILHVDLTAGTTRAEQPDESFYRLYGGGGLLATHYLLRGAPAGTDAFDPGAPLVFAPGLLAGQPCAGLATCSIVAKSPLTGGVGEGRTHGPLGPALKAAGVDAVVVSGRAQAPVVLEIADGRPQLHAAGASWGERTGAVRDRLARSFGDDAVIAAIGPAGERLVRSATVVSGAGFRALRGGMGAVMGSKQLKALVVRPRQVPIAADAATLRRMDAEYARAMLDNDLCRRQYEPPGGFFDVDVHRGWGFSVPFRNFQRGDDPQLDSVAADVYAPLYRQDVPCAGCPNNCYKTFAPDPGATAAAARPFHWETVNALGVVAAVGSPAAIVRLNELIADEGLDTASLAATIAFVAEAIERGVLTAQEVGLDVTFGDGDAALELAHRIAAREGFGDLLAEGVARASAAIGRGSEAFAMHVKGMELEAWEPRSQSNLALGFAVGPTGPRMDVCEHDSDWDPDPAIGYPHSFEIAKTLGVLSRFGVDDLDPAKVRMFHALHTFYVAADVLGACINAIDPSRQWTIEKLTAMVAATTGWSTSGYELMRWGQRSTHIMRLYNNREGLTADDDRLPDRFFDDPVPVGHRAGGKLDRDALRASLQRYYRTVGWDDAGRPTEAVLYDHFLEHELPHADTSGR